MANRITFLLGTPRLVSIGISTTPEVDGERLIPLIEPVVFDASLSEQHTLEAEVTQHPVETGSPISDHYRVLPQKIVINGIVSDSPMPADHIGGLFTSRDGLVSTANKLITGKSRVDEAYDSLRKKMDESSLLDVVTTLKTYENMAITSLAIERDASSGNILNSTISLQEIKIVEVSDTPIPKAPAKKALTKKGPQGETPADKSEVQKVTTFRGLVKAAGG